jgi:hypothetical protein
MKRKAGTLSIIRGGRLLAARAHRAEPADLLIDGDRSSGAIPIPVSLTAMVMTPSAAVAVTPTSRWITRR